MCTVLSSLCASLALAGHTWAADDAALPEGVTVLADLHYRDGGTSKACVLDLALPKSSGQRRPAIVVIHGGGWIEGDKSSFSNLQHKPPGNIFDYAKLGFVAATINYRLAGEAPFPAQLDDCRAAIRWLRAHADKYQIDSDHVGVWGNSAGGHLALLLGLMPQPASGGNEPYSDWSARVQAVVSDSGPLDLLTQYKDKQLYTVIEKLMGGPPQNSLVAEYKRASPSSYADGDVAGIPPLLMIYGAADGQVNVHHADAFVAALGRAGHKDLSYFRLAGVDHCPHSLVRIDYLQDVVCKFFGWTLKSSPRR